MKLRPSYILRIVPRLCQPLLVQGLRLCPTSSEPAQQEKTNSSFLQTSPAQLFKCNLQSLFFNSFCHSYYIILQVSCRRVLNDILMHYWKRDGSARRGANYSRIDHFHSTLLSIYNATSCARRYQRSGPDKVKRALEQRGAHLHMNKMCPDF